MEEKCCIACYVLIAVLIIVAIAVVIVCIKWYCNNHHYSKAAVAADAEENSEIGRTMEEKCRIACYVLTAALILTAVLTAVLIVCIKCHQISMRNNDHCYSKAAVAAANGKCSEIGRDMLQRGGSAVDAAIAALLCVGLFNAHSMGFGGGHFFIIYNSSTGEVETIDARETAPQKATRDMFGNDTQLAQKGGLSIAVPGELRGYELAHRRHGRLPWRELFQPSIKLAREGIRVSKGLAEAMQKNKEDIEANPVLCEVFCDSNKTILRENDIIRFPQLADTYEKIAEGGADVFYNGSMAETIVKDIKDAGYNFSSSSVSTIEKKTLTYHRIIEAFRFAFAKRSRLGDPRYVKINELIHDMTSDYFADNIRSKISDDSTQPESYYDPIYFNHKSYGTAHLSIIAEDGSAVAVTSSINLPFGSKVMSRSTGIIFNNMMDDFSSPYVTNAYNVPPSPNNFIQPGKRPLSSMCPTIICDKNNKVKMVVGAAGGTKITTATALVILNSLFFNYDVKRAVEEPRFHNQLNSNKTEVEKNFDQSVKKGLEQKKHNTPLQNTTSLVQAVVRQDDLICAVSDQRKGGYAVGY
ncbi:hypothetical protein PHYPO_G00238670 [Pangasianodon hypophthalmus]|uniref:Glutathione hydrolase n=1 Tax=Pangasianodon hypophthalmus TaxID=310915 RepID=A0A5N5NM07_PANHP|nr:hypothetical protein PHYPO_G00238670 [Pangasianodon hypophthalmus]